jgi:hypothetical protein
MKLLARSLGQPGDGERWRAVTVLLVEEDLGGDPLGLSASRASSGRSR